MKDIREIIHSAHLTKTQKIIADFVLDHSSKACFMTSTEIADYLDISESSVIRFSRTLGFSGFIEFQKYLRKEYQDQVYSISSSITVPSQRMAQFRKHGTDTNYMKKHLNAVMQNIEQLFASNSLDVFEEAANLLVSSNHKYIYATRGNYSISNYAILYLTQMLPNVINIHTPGTVPYDHLCYAGEGDCLLLFSFPRYSNIDYNTAKMAKDRNVKVILFTDKPSALLSPFADVLIIASSESDSFNNSLVAPQFALECLLEAISYKDLNIEQNLNEIDVYLNELKAY